MRGPKPGTKVPNGRSTSTLPRLSTALSTFAARCVSARRHCAPAAVACSHRGPQFRENAVDILNTKCQSSGRDSNYQFGAGSAEQGGVGNRERCTEGGEEREGDGGVHRWRARLPAAAAGPLTRAPCQLCSPPGSQTALPCIPCCASTGAPRAATAPSAAPARQGRAGRDSCAHREGPSLCAATVGRTSTASNQAQRTPSSGCLVPSRRKMVIQQSKACCALRCKLRCPRTCTAASPCCARRASMSWSSCVASHRWSSAE